MLYQPITVTVDALARVMRLYGLGGPHMTLAAGAVWTEPDSDRLADQAALRIFAESGMANDVGLHRGLVDSLAVLARPTTEFYGWFTNQDTTTGVLAAAIGGDAVLARRRDDRIQLVPADPERLAEAIVGCLPQVPPARGSSINVPRSRLRAGRVTTGDEAAFDRLRQRPATGAGELHAAIRDRMTQRRFAARYSIGYHDTTEGRWWLQVIPGHDDEWIVAAPATRELLITRLRDAQLDLWRQTTGATR